MRLTTSILLAGLLCSSLAWAAAPKPPPSPPPQPKAEPPSQAACTPLPKPRSGPLPFAGGETLTYDVDIVGAKAGQMTFDVDPWGRNASEIQVKVSAESNTFFNKMRKIKGEVVSFLRAKDLRPNRFHEDVEEGGLTRVADALFKDKKTEVNWTSNQPNNPKGTNHFTTTSEAYDYVGAIYLFRAISDEGGPAVLLRGLRAQADVAHRGQGRGPRARLGAGRRVRRLPSVGSGHRAQHEAAGDPRLDQRRRPAPSGGRLGRHRTGPGARAARRASSARPEGQRRQGEAGVVSAQPLRDSARVPDA
ncbi:MAG: DUF3108 domain-containing protein [Myxococcales bacterium]